VLLVTVSNHRDCKVVIGQQCWRSKLVENTGFAVTMTIHREVFYAKLEY